MVHQKPAINQPAHFGQPVSQQAQLSLAWAGHKKDGIITSLFSFDEVATIYSFSFDFYYFSFNATL